MKFKAFTLVLAGFTAAAVGALTVAADAAPRGRDQTVVRWQDENGRVRTRIIIQKRSYLDAGTNVQPGERKFTDYVIPPNRSTVPEAMRNTAADRASQTMPGPFDLPGKNNPRQW